MFRARSKLQRRDLDSGLVFSWRIPVSSSMSLVMSVLLVGMVTAAIAAFVRVKIGNGGEREFARGSLVLVSLEDGGMRLERLAIEAGPFPSRWNPAADPEYAALRRRALREASEVEIPYLASLTELEDRDEEDWGCEGHGHGVLPDLPPALVPAAAETQRETRLGVQVIRSSKGAWLQIPDLPLAAKDAVPSVGLRFLIEHDAQGRIVEVISLNPDDRSADLGAWLARARVLDHLENAGWLVVESVIEP